VPRALLSKMRSGVTSKAFRSSVSRPYGCTTAAVASATVTACLNARYGVPSSVATAATFNLALGRRLDDVLSDETRVEGHQALGPSALTSIL